MVFTTDSEKFRRNDAGSDAVENGQIDRSVLNEGPKENFIWPRLLDLLMSQAYKSTKSKKNLTDTKLEIRNLADTKHEWNWKDNSTRLSIVESLYTTLLMARREKATQENLQEKLEGSNWDERSKALWCHLKRAKIDRNS